ncbi:hypothetical protein ACCD10_11370 [Pseudomonas sp. Pseusp122]|uniref:hypothetical protein n=1 Tax=unclassified Pseudomonas TaxID=196821 RepID=UPI0039A43338
MQSRKTRIQMNRHEVASAMYTHIMRSWEELPEDSKRALGFDCIPGSESEEQALRHMARLFIEYAELSFGRALMARRRRLGLDA